MVANRARIEEISRQNVFR